MNPFLSLSGKTVSLLFVFFLPGYLTTLLFKINKSFSFLISILLSSLIGLFLAQSGLFSLGHLVWPLVFYSLVLYICLFRKKSVTGKLEKFRYRDNWFIVSLIVLSIFLFFRPHQYLEGGWDPGTYFNTGINIAKTGSIKIQDKVWENLTPQEQEIFSHTRAQRQQKYPGFMVFDSSKGTIIPRFYHLYPVWIAIFYSLFGLKFSLYVNSFFALLGLLAFYQAARVLFNRRVALLATLFLCISAIQIWYARFPTSEILSQYLLWSAVYVLALYDEENKASLAVIGAVCLGTALLSSLTVILILPGVILYFFYRNWEKFKRTDLFFIVPFILSLFFLVFQTVFVTEHYFSHVYWYHYQYNPAKYKVIIAVTAVLITLLILKIFSRKTKPFFDRICQEQQVRNTSALIILVFAFYGYFLRPKVLTSNFNATNLQELALFLTPFGFWLAIFGFVTLLRREFSRKKLLFILFTLTFSFIFFHNKVLAPSYPWALRRYVPFIIPSFYLMNSYLILEISRWEKITAKLAATGMVIYLLIFPFTRNLLLVKQVDYQGIIGFSKSIAEQMKEDGVYICDGYWLATPLHFIYDKNTLSVSDQTIPKAQQVISIIKKWLEEGKNVFYISREEKVFTPEVDFQEIGKANFKSSRLEHPLRQLPREIKKLDTEVKIFKLKPVSQQPLPEHGKYFIDIGRNCFGLNGGFDQARIYSRKITARWTHQTAEVTIPWPEKNSDVTIILKMNGRRPREEKLTRLSVYIDKTFIKEFEVANQAKEYQLSIPSQTVKTVFPHRAILRLKSTTWNPHQYGVKGYGSELGVILDWVKVEF